MNRHHCSNRKVRRKLHQFILLGLSSLLIASVWPTRAFAYEGDHYTWTYYLALHVGYTKRQAFQIASGAYAIDWDKDTGPMEATPGDAIYGARHPGITGTSHPQIAIIWSKFHAFAEANYVGVGNEVEKARVRDRELLWALAKQQRNPGPLLHFAQDYHSHFDFDNVRGHAVLGHKPDFISNDPHYKARSMTKDTVAWLQRFMREVLGGSPKEPDWARIWEVLDRVAQADPVPNVLYPGNFNPYGGTGSPSLSRSMSVINRAVEEDEASGRLRPFPDPAYNPMIPAKWYQYAFDADGRVNDALYPVEKPQFELGKEQVEVTPIDDNNFKIKLRLTYKLAGLLSLRDGNGQSFLSPLPVYEKQVLSDTPQYPKTATFERGNGEFTIEIEIQRGRSQLERGVTWTGTIDAHGFESQSKQVTIPVPADTQAAQDCKALIARSQQLMSAGDPEKAAVLLEEAKQKCAGMHQNLADQLNQTRKELEEEIDKIVNDAQESINNCKYEEALGLAQRLQQINPNPPWLAVKLAQLELDADAQRQAREYLRPGLEAIQRKDLDAAIASLRQARGVPGVPKCMLDQIKKLLGELERHKHFIELSEKVEQATKKCDYKETARVAGEIARLSPREDYATNWLNTNLPKLAELQNRERRAINLINEAELVANQADVAASTEPVDWNRVVALVQQALKALADADQVAPKCLSDRQRMEAIRLRLLEIQRRKKPQIATSIVLLIDTSGSMRDNNKINQAKEAARISARQVSKTVEIAVLNFDGGCDAGALKYTAPFTTDLNVLLSAIDRLAPGGGTPMYFATGLAVEYATKQARGKQRSVILLSDGADTCQGQKAQAAAAIRTSNIPVSTIGYDVGNNAAAQNELREIAGLTGGRTFSASAADPREIIRAVRDAMLPSLIKGADVGGPAAGYFNQATMLVQQQNLNGALLQLQQAHRLAPDSPNVNFNLSLLHEAQDQLIPAVNYANNYLNLAPSAPDRPDVENRISEIQQELQRNPRMMVDSSSCPDMLAWAQAEQNAVKRGRDVARRQDVLEILIATQRGECEKARQLAAGYKRRYP